MSIFLGVLALIAGMTLIIAPAMAIDDHTGNGWLALGWASFATLLIAGLIGYAADHAPPSEHFTLATADWECVSTYQERQFTGKIYVMVTRCAAYARKEK